MMFSIGFYFTIGTLLLQQTSTAEAKLLMTVMLNNGTLPTAEGFTCNPQDSQLIKNAIGADAAADDDDDDDDDDDRRLQRATCKDQCRFYVAGSCHVTGCLGFRRRTQEEDKRAKRLSVNRKLDDEKLYCPSGIKKLNAELDSIIPQLSAGCRPLVQRKRTLSCFDNVRYAAVESFDMWNADNDTIVQSNIQNNAAFCLSNSNLNIEAVANACVEKMVISIKGPVSSSRAIEASAPYSIFGNIGTDFSGRKLPVGKYTIETKLDGSSTPTSKVMFVVNKC